MRILSARHALALSLLLALSGCTSSGSNSSWWKSNPFKSASTAPPSPYPVKPSQQYASTANANPSASLNSASPATPTGVPPVGATVSRGPSSGGTNNPFGAGSSGPSSSGAPFTYPNTPSRGPSGTNTAVAADGTMAPQRGMYEMPAGYNAPSQATASAPPPGPSMGAFAPPSGGAGQDAPSYRTATTPRYDTPSNRYGAAPAAGSSTPDRYATPSDRYTTPFDRGAAATSRVPSYPTSPDSRSATAPTSGYTAPSGATMPSQYDPSRSPRTDYGSAVPSGPTAVPSGGSAAPYGPSTDYRPSSNYGSPAAGDYRTDPGPSPASPYRMPSGPSSASPSPSGYNFPTSSTSLPSPRSDDLPPYRPGSVGSVTPSSNLAGPQSGAAAGSATSPTSGSRFDAGVTPAGYTPATAGLPASPRY